MDGRISAQTRHNKTYRVRFGGLRPLWASTELLSSFEGSHSCVRQLCWRSTVPEFQHIVSVYAVLKVLKDRARADLPKCCQAAIVSGLKKQKVQTTTMRSLAGLQESVAIYQSQAYDRRNCHSTFGSEVAWE